MREDEKPEGQYTEQAAEDDDVDDISFAEQEFVNWCDANGIDHAEEDMEEDDRKDFRKIKKRFAKAVDEKRLVSGRYKYCVHYFPVFQKERRTDSHYLKAHRAGLYRYGRLQGNAADAEVSRLYRFHRQNRKIPYRKS